MATSYEIICEAARAAPMSENLLLDDQPASMVESTPMPEMASTNRTPASSGAICMT
jgi:hypothetical protein